MPGRFEFWLASRFASRSAGLGVYPFLMIAFATTFIIVIISVAEGFDGELVSKMIGVSSHVEVASSDGFGFSEYDRFISDVRSKFGGRVAGIAPRFVTDAIISHGEFSSGIRLVGVDATRETAVSPFFPKDPFFLARSPLPAGRRNVRSAEGMELGDFSGSGAAAGTRETGVLREASGNGFFLAGTVLSRKLSMKPGSIAKVTTLSKDVRFFLSGTFEIGVYDYDFSFAFCDLAALQKALSYEGVATSVMIRLRDETDAEDFADDLKSAFPKAKFSIRTWREANKSLFATIAIERTVLYIIIFLTVVLANIGIAFISALNVFRRAKSVAIMRALGTPQETVAGAFFYEGVIIGSLGLAAGVAAGVALAAFIGYLAIGVPAEVAIYYSVSTVPVKISPFPVFAVAVIEAVVLLLTCLISAKSLNEVEVLETLRNNQ